MPEDVRSALEGRWGNLSQRLTENLALDGYRQGLLSLAQVRRLLGLATRWEAQEFLGSHANRDQMAQWCCIGDDDHPRLDWRFASANSWSAASRSSSAGSKSNTGIPVLERADVVGLLSDLLSTLARLEASGFYLSARLRESVLARHRNRHGIGS
jgi:hypothetical protein